MARRDRFVWLPEHLERVQQYGLERKSSRETAALINEEFGTDYDQGAVKRLKRKMGWKFGHPRYCYLFTPEQISFIKDNYHGSHWRELTEELNKKFGTDFTYEQVTSFAKNRRMSNGLKPGGKFVKGMKFPGRRNAGTFFKGQHPWNTTEVGTEFIYDGYTFVKTAQPRVKRAKHRMIYEHFHGVKLKADDVVIFLDGDKSNCTPNNLALISRVENLKLTSNRYRFSSANLTKTGLAVVRLEEKVKERKNNETIKTKG